MLAKMGFKKGEGLGKKGEGITEPLNLISTVYQPFNQKRIRCAEFKKSSKTVNISLKKLFFSPSKKDARSIWKEGGGAALTVARKGRKGGF
jgi:hypothetical protein